ncbi:MAG TPA: FAD-binding protein, partial [Bacteroidota bacterium]
MARHLRIREQVPLAPYTTLGLGGPARFFAGCRSDADLLEGVHLAKDLNLRLLFLGGGSNVVIADEGFDGLVLKIETRGTLRESTPEGIRLTVAAGERWDDFVCSCIDQGLAGVECLSGIPGSVGATPIQNVGAYGQEVSQTIQEVSVMDVRTGDDVVFRNADCRFAYRQSRFKHEDAGRYIVTS